MDDYKYDNLPRIYIIPKSVEYAYFNPLKLAIVVRYLKFKLQTFYSVLVRIVKRRMSSITNHEIRNSE